jgi:uncharacterized damage-inducible protein DinB
MSTRTPSRTALALVALALVSSLAASTRADEPVLPAGVKGEILMWIADAEGKLIQLAEAMPEGKYAWRPGKGVRTVGEVFMHVSGANFGIPGFLGVAPPDGFKFDTYEQSLTKKSDIVKSLKDSFAHVKKALSATTDADMDKPVDLFGMKTTVRGAYLLVLSHAHEHLGQSIAYARSNDVTPPWSAKDSQK